MGIMRVCGCLQPAARLAGVAVLLLLYLGHALPALGDARVALVIGNGSYGPEIGALKNPANDARLIAATLEELGFSVDLVLDADQKALKRAVIGFGAKLRDAGTQGIGLFYYAGHGLQVGGENFLIPIGAQISAEGDVEIEAVSASSILSQMQYAGNTVNLVFLDACRNNPLTRGFRTAARGLARVDAPQGSFIGYSTAPGDVAEDGVGDNSAYALALAAELRRPGIAVDTAHRNVRSKVLEATGKRQTPWDSSSLIGEVVLAPVVQAPEVQVPAPVQEAANQQAELLFWESIRDSTDPIEYQAYLDQYPAGSFAKLAKAKIAKYGTPAAAPAPEPEPPAQPMAAAETAALPQAVTPDPIEIDILDATYVTKRSANVRAAPDTNSAVLARLKEDDAVAVTGKVKDKDWYQVKSGDAAGYVSAKLLAEADADEIAAWHGLRKGAGEDSIRAFLQAYPDGYFRPKAEALLTALQKPAPEAAEASAATPTAATPTAAATQAPAAALPAPAPEVAAVTHADAAIRVGNVYDFRAEFSGVDASVGLLTIKSADDDKNWKAHWDLLSGGKKFLQKMDVEQDGDELVLTGTYADRGYMPDKCFLEAVGPGRYEGNCQSGGGAYRGPAQMNLKP